MLFRSYYEQNISEDEVRLVLNRAEIPEEEHDELVEALGDTSHPRNEEIWDILRNDDYFADGWEHTEDDMWTDRKGGYDVEDTCEDVTDDGSEV